MIVKISANKHGRNIKPNDINEFISKKKVGFSLEAVKSRFDLFNYSSLRSEEMYKYVFEDRKILI